MSIKSIVVVLVITIVIYGWLSVALVKEGKKIINKVNSTLIEELLK